MEGISLLQDFATILLVAGLAGWVFRRLGLSAVVGYLLAGVLIGPSTPPFSLVSDTERIQDLSELGLVFLMFFVGMGLSLKRIKRLGGTVVVATALTALVVFSLAQLFAWSAGWSTDAGLIFAAMLMVSSSAIISKMLAERGLSHEQFGQTAQGVTILEDVVAVVMLTIIGSRLHMTSGESQGVGHTLYLLLGFVALLMVLGLILVPRLLRPLRQASDADIKSLVVSGLVFGAGVIAMQAGFSVALGAFLFGVVIAETPFRAQIERRLGGAQDMFSAIFFVSIGMLIDVQSFVDHAGLILLVSVFAIVARTLAALIGLLGSGQTLGLAASSAIVLTPLGEFSYIIAQLGVAGGAVPEMFYAVAVGASLVTAVLAPFFAGVAERFGLVVERVQPATVRGLLARYRDWLAEAGAGMGRSRVWQFARRGVVSILIELIMLAGLFGFSYAVQTGIGSFFSRAGYDLPGWNFVYWGLVLLAAVVLAAAILRNLHALSMLFAEALTMRSRKAPNLRPLVQVGFQGLGVVGLALVVFLTFPFSTTVPWVAFVVIGSMGVFAIVLWRHLIRLQSRLERTLAESVESQESARTRLVRVADGAQSRDWNMDVSEALLPDQAACAGRTIQDLALRSRFGCSILEIDRQGFVIDHPRPELALFPGDRVLLFGTEAQIQAARQELQTERAFTPDESDFDEAMLETVEVPTDSAVSGRSLIELEVFKKTGVQVMGIEKAGHRILNPAGTSRLEAGDRLLVMATNSEIRAFREWLAVGGLRSKV